jgi:hypothetical protein
LIAPRLAGISGPNPIIDLVDAKLPESSDLMTRQPFAIDPLVDGIPTYPKMPGNFFDREPAVIHRKRASAARDHADIVATGIYTVLARSIGQVKGMAVQTPR